LQKYNSVIGAAQETEWKGEQMTDEEYFIMFHSRSMVNYISDIILNSMANQNMQHTITVQIWYLEIWVISIVEEIKLLLLPSNRLVMTSRLATVGQACQRRCIHGSASCLVIFYLFFTIYSRY
jgi:hypothetical protein